MSKSRLVWEVTDADGGPIDVEARGKDKIARELKARGIEGVYTIKTVHGRVTIGVDKRVTCAVE